MNVSDIDGAEITAGDVKGFAVVPKADCEHIASADLITDVDKEKIRQDNCENCGESETWLCLSCSKINCSRHKNCCAVIHGSEAGHPIALSLTDLSNWCYQCDSYITSPSLNDIKRNVYIAKFERPPPAGSELDMAGTSSGSGI
ncbi:hypothetical protein NQZ79_g8648 [Umbelopsis isabellina]|nr:hypothetical protein NQZ79_g8648 [Umbelopsis isabellina]